MLNFYKTIGKSDKKSLKPTEKEVVVNITNSNIKEEVPKTKKVEEKKKIKKNSIDVFVSLNCFGGNEEKSNKLSTITE
ncbi:hypothetical protein HK099_007692 [Clydaea vesicula]|uniref:Uncharacterized protein n=1 Tax=Clydaea vesicula TaxID=447962 RepID=A0AAD5Y0I3_9FUNG|nr:hypothetical protein HK099_007691 [Clydaea vesicula]KAJ3224898.1 hypothetical protein HK099_007692 [Clydaea vesicula]